MTWLNTVVSSINLDVKMTDNEKCEKCIIGFINEAPHYDFEYVHEGESSYFHDTFKFCPECGHKNDWDKLSKESEC